MAYLESVKTGAALNRRTARKQPMELMARYRAADPVGSKERIISKWKKTVQEDDDYTSAVLDYAGQNMWTDLDKTEREDNDRKQRAERRAEIYAEEMAEGKSRAEKERETITAASEQVKKIVVLNWLMPNGKRLGDVTFGYCRKLEGFIGRIGKMGKPNEIVGKKLSNDQLMKIATHIMS